MKKYFAIIALLAHFLATAQCLSPSNLILTNNILETQLHWTENGNIYGSEVTVVPNFDVGTPVPLFGAFSATTNQITLSNLPPGCNAYFVRSQCAFNPSVYSDWAIILSSNCSPNAFTYAATLSNNVYNLDKNEIKLYPNPTKNSLNIENANNDTIDFVNIYTTLGQEISSITHPSSAIDVSNLTTGTYFIKIKSGSNEVNLKFIKE